MTKYYAQDMFEYLGNDRGQRNAAIVIGIAEITLAIFNNGYNGT